MLWFFRCQDCLSTMTYSGPQLDALCACGGYLESLGQVIDGRAIERHKTPICDGRCISAQGPDCDCACGGVNHGTRWSVTVTIDNGRAIVKPVDSAALQRGEEFRTAKQAIRDALAHCYGADFEKFRAGQWVSDKSAWWKMRQTLDSINKIETLRTHKNRMAKLDELLKSI